jgi:sec-independent protein translocase protein TatB
MFDVSFSELVVIALVALIVIGPERLPRVARTVGALLGRLQRYVNDVKADINREIQLDELKKLQQQVADQAKSMEQSVTEQLKATETALNESIAPGSEGTSIESPAEVAQSVTAAPATIELPPKA